MLLVAVMRRSRQDTLGLVTAFFVPVSCSFFIQHSRVVDVGTYIEQLIYVIISSEVKESPAWQLQISFKLLALPFNKRVILQTRDY